MAMDSLDRFDFSSLSALVVDDNIHMRRLMRDILHVFGIGTVYEAADGSDAHTTMKEQFVDLVLCDWVMQNLSGIDLLRRVREPGTDVLNPAVAFLMMTAHTDEWRLEEAKKAGATAILVKPFSTAALYERIMNIIEPQNLSASYDELGNSW